MLMVSKSCVILAFCLPLAGVLDGCGPDYTPPIPAGPAPGPEGYYAGVMVSDVDGSEADVVALVSDSGEVRIIDALDGIQFLAAVPLEGGDLSTSALGFAGPSASFRDTTSLCHGSLAGTLYPAAEFFGNYDCGGDRGSFDLLYDDNISFNPPVTAQLAGALVGSTGGVTVLTLIVDPDGSYSGSDTAGCTYSGSFVAGDSVVDIYTVTLQQACGATMSFLSGLAMPAPAPDSGAPALYIGVSDSSRSLAGLLEFQ